MDKISFNIIFSFTDDKGSVIDRSEPTNMPFIPRIGEYIYIKSLLTKRDYFGLKKNDFLERNKDKFIEDGHEYPLKIDKVIYSKKNSSSEANIDDMFVEIHLGQP